MLTPTFAINDAAIFDRLLQHHTLLVQAAQEKVLATMATLLALPVDEAAHLLHTNKPTLRLASSRVTVGRVSLSREVQDARITDLAATAAGSTTGFAHTGHAMRLMQAVCAGIALNEPTLLVGEAGTGKTALIQHLADQVCRAGLAALLFFGDY